MSPMKLQSMWLLTTVVFLYTCCGTSAHHMNFTRCPLSRELMRYNFPRTQISNWVCIIEQGSESYVDRITNHTAAHLRYGLFQISGKDWCKKGRKGGHCSVKCEDLLNKDLSDDVRCAKRVYDKHGFQGWPEWHAQCKGKNLPDVSRC